MPCFSLFACRALENYSLHYLVDLELHHLHAQMSCFINSWLWFKNDFNDDDFNYMNFKKHVQITREPNKPVLGQ